MDYNKYKSFIDRSAKNSVNNSHKFSIYAILATVASLCAISHIGFIGTLLVIAVGIVLGILGGGSVGWDTLVSNPGTQFFLFLGLMLFTGSVIGAIAVHATVMCTYQAFKHSEKNYIIDDTIAEQLRQEQKRHPKKQYSYRRSHRRNHKKNF